MTEQEQPTNSDIKAQLDCIESMLSKCNGKKDLRTNYISWIINEIGNRETYHNHKETMAWVATALFVPAIILAASKVSDLNLLQWQYIPIGVFVILFASLVSIFVCKQFRLRSQSADEVVALTSVLNDLISNSNYPDTKDITTSNNDSSWPKFIQTEIDNKRGKGRKLSDIMATDVVTYFVIWLATIVSICLLCIQASR